MQLKTVKLKSSIVELNMSREDKRLPVCLRIADAAVLCEECRSRGTDSRSDIQLGCSSRGLRPNQHLFIQSDLPTFTYQVASGAFRLYRILQNGRRQILGFKYPGDFILGEASRRFNVQAISMATVRVFPRTVLDALANESNAFVHRLNEIANSELSSLYDQVSIVGTSDPEASVVAFLLNLEMQILKRNGSVSPLQIPMLRSDIADYLGITHETVSRIFTTLKKRGLISLAEGRRVRICNRHELENIARRIVELPQTARFAALSCEAAS